MAAGDRGIRLRRRPMTHHMQRAQRRVAGTEHGPGMRADGSDEFRMIQCSTAAMPAPADRPHA
jgi:hypothetical protein